MYRRFLVAATFVLAWVFQSLSVDPDGGLNFSTSMLFPDQATCEQARATQDGLVTALAPNQPYQSASCMLMGAPVSGSETWSSSDGLSGQRNWTVSH